MMATIIRSERPQEVHRPITLTRKRYLAVEDTQLYDIRQQTERLNLIPEILNGLRREHKELPSLLLWDSRGLGLFDVILDSTNYYPSKREPELLQARVRKIASTISSGDRVIELGAGNMRKTALILRTLEEQGKEIEYFALDVARAALKASLRELALLFPAPTKIKLRGLLGTYEDCASWLRWNESTTKTSLLWLGNSIANFKPVEAAALLANFFPSGRQTPTMIIGVDGCQDQSQIMKSYENENSAKFVLNGLKHANNLLGAEVFRSSDWGFAARWNSRTMMHESFYIAEKDIILKIEGETFHCRKGECVKAIMSGKWPLRKVSATCKKAGVQVLDSWMNEEQSYGMLVQKL
ncbi:Ergothioneine biosynthesis protein 1-like protein 1 [Phlyctema vagabunda]|uniref:Ergothioneine biosynthesis protein 1-like protein 1 n=1 Tax=Phlyctema vagabunda TaxID=108571 RepID=A0ABR4PCY5_9HELO